MRIYRVAGQRVAPWKNGGGTTREIVCLPEGATLDAFVFRVSRASVVADGPFSTFPGVDRTLIVLSGAGLRLNVAARGSFALTPSSGPFAFSGDVEVTAELARGPIEDLNVMTRRDRARHEAVRAEWTGTGSLPLRGDAAVLVVERGALVVGDEALAEGDAVMWGSADAPPFTAHDRVGVVIVDVWGLRETGRAWHLAAPAEP